MAWKMMEYDERCKYLLTRQKEIEAELEKLKLDVVDRRSRRGNELQGEYAEIVDELENMDAGKWKPRVQ